MSWCIAADSSCNLRGYTPETPHLSFRLAPLKVNVGSIEYVDDENLDVDALNQAVAIEASASSSSCPSVGEWTEIFKSADNVIAVTISSNLSGSYDSAMMARNIVLDEYARDHNGVIAGKNIYVLNSRAAGGKLELIVTLLDRYLSNNPTFGETVEYAKKLEATSQVLFSLSSYENLVKAGRMPRVAGAIASRLNIRILGTASSEGTIKLVGPSRGEKKAIRGIIDTMVSDGYHGGFIAIDHVNNEHTAELLKSTLLEQWPNAEIKILACGGLCSYYAEASGIIVGYGWL